MRVFVLAVLLWSAGCARAATLLPGFFETSVATGLIRPTAMAFAPDGRLFVTQQDGAVRVIKNGALLATPFVTLAVNADGERGLLGIAFDPDFAANHFLYLYYTVPTTPRHNRASRFTADGDIVLAGSELPILELNNLSGATNHNGGAMHFGPDGKLYIGVGENANSANAQTLANLLGKILRLNSDGSVPLDNPFVGTATGINQAIWAMGLRNPYSFAFQDGVGRMFINDVGENTFEEINEGLAGANYGWPLSEGTATGTDKSPVYFYGHGNGPMLGCAITGGTFYNPVAATFPASYTGAYFFSDLCGDWINKLDPATGIPTTFASGIDAPVDQKIGPDGGLYYLARGSASNTGVVFRIDAAVATTTSIATHTPNPSTLGAPIAVTATAIANAPGVGATTGTITVSDGTTNCVITLPATACTLTPATAGLKTLVATYSGDAHYLASVSPGVAHSVNAGAGGAPTLQSASLRKNHAAAGDFSLPLALVLTAPTVEPRQGTGATLVFTFEKAITGAAVTVAEGTAMAGAPVFVGNSVQVSLTGIADVQYLKVTLTAVASADGGTGGTAGVRIGVLQGDVNQSRSVTPSDLLAANAVLTLAVTTANFLSDVNLSGTLTASDLLAVNAGLTHALPAP